MILLEKVLVPRGGFQVNEIWFCFQMFVVRIATAPTNRTTNKIFLWISLVPKPRSARYDAGIPAPYLTSR
ncbi:hypothetical protein MESS4_60127 [Mesorhizobium sp. STM 4661]|nr:hypothetical protein MESS4_60127 [Mesorhizobium sp. STM 4661]